MCYPIPHFNILRGADLEGDVQQVAVFHNQVVFIVHIRQSHHPYELKIKPDLL